MELNSSGHWILIYLETVTKFCNRTCSVGEGRKQLGVLNDRIFKIIQRERKQI